MLVVVYGYLDLLSQEDKLDKGIQKGGGKLKKSKQTNKNNKTKTRNKQKN